MVNLLNTINFWILIPEIFVFCQILIFFFSFTFLKSLKIHQNFINIAFFYYFCLFCFFSGLVFLFHSQFFNLNSGVDTSLVSESIRIEVVVQKLKGAIFLLTAVVVFFLGFSDLKQNHNFFKFLNFLGFCLFGICLLFNSFKLFEAILALESISFCTYFLLSSERLAVKNSLEASIKYFCVGGLASVFLFFGSMLFFYLCPTGLDYLSVREVLNNCSGTSWFIAKYAFFLITIGFFFKLSIFPFHLWTPEVYDGVSSTLITFFTVVIKLAVIVYFYKISFSYYLPLILEFRFFFYAAALGSIIAGAVGASLQFRVQRVIGFSSINFMGYFLTIFFCEPSFSFCVNFYNFFLYSVAILGFFCFLVRYFSDSGEKIEVFSQFIYLGKSTKLGGWPLAFCLLSLGGVPPFPGFFGKLLVLSSLAFSHFFIFFLLAAITNILTYYYSLRIIKMLFFLELEKKGPVFVFNSSHFSKFFIFFFSLFLFFFLFMFFFLEILLKIWISFFI